MGDPNFTPNFTPISPMLHAFQKKSKTGLQTPRRHMELVKQRLREAEQLEREMTR